MSQPALPALCFPAKLAPPDHCSPARSSPAVVILPRPIPFATPPLPPARTAAAFSTPSPAYSIPALAPAIASAATPPSPGPAVAKSRAPPLRRLSRLRRRSAHAPLPHPSTKHKPLLRSRQQLSPSLCLA